ncbi:hypothetical protein [Paractinoplanes globisporus]|uniref:Uncharacterized protein n=1 Tax=Paractinoplanes globisporus TaxID=113565 RepID=A0ABW6W6F0_9ACTN|nr:hypothetical protein [Actinoplanes globisporus]
MRMRRAGRIGLDEADRLAAGGRAGPGKPGLDHLLDAVRAPATAGEKTGGQAVAAGLAAERRRAALTTGPKGSIRVEVPRARRTVVVSIATGIAVLSLGGTAVAAGTGSLPAGLQERAHSLFSALGVPAPRTGPSISTPAPSGSTATPRPTSAPATPTPTATSPRPAQVVAWCAAWRTAEDGGKPMNGRDRRELTTAAGGAESVARYCAGVTGSGTPGATTGTTKPGAAPSHRATPSHPTPHATTPSHPGPNK